MTNNYTWVEYLYFILKRSAMPGCSLRKMGKANTGLSCCPLRQRSLSCSRIQISSLIPDKMPVTSCSLAGSSCNTFEHWFGSMGEICVLSIDFLEHSDTMCKACSWALNNLCIKLLSSYLALQTACFKWLLWTARHNKTSNQHRLSLFFHCGNALAVQLKVLRLWLTSSS